MQHEDIFITYQAEEFTYVESPKEWFIGIGAVTVAGVVLSLVLDNPLFAIICVLIGGLFAYFSQKKPGVITVTVSDKGVRCGHEAFPYNKIDHFWMITTNAGIHHLLLRTPLEFDGIAIVPIAPEVNPEDIAHILSDYVPMQEIKESALTVFLERFGY